MIYYIHIYIGVQASGCVFTGWYRDVPGTIEVKRRKIKANKFSSCCRVACFVSCTPSHNMSQLVRMVFHQRIQVPNLEVLYLIRLFSGVGIPLHTPSFLRVITS